MHERLRPTRETTPDAPWYWTAAFAAVFFCLTFGRGAPSAGADLDQSWAAVLGWAHLHGLRFGHDIVFTYGPLGWLHPRAPFEPALYFPFLFWQVLLGLGYTFLYAGLFRRLAAFERIVFAAMALFGCGTAADVLFLGTGIVAVVSLDRYAAATRGLRTWIGLTIIALQVNAVALIKFTAFPIAVALGATGVLLFAYRQRRRMALAWAGLWTATLLGLWLGSGQLLVDLPAYVRTSWWNVEGYGAAMNMDADGPTLAFGLATLAAGALALGVWWRDERWRDLRSFVLAGHLALCLWIAWKSTYTRADFYHTRYFFAPATFVVFALMALRCVERRRWMYAGAALTGAVAIVTTNFLWMHALPGPVPGTAKRVAGMAVTQSQHLARRAQLQQELDLPALRARIGDARVDLLGCAQGVMLLNGFHYAPRPVFQSYGAYTTPLQQINEAYYLGPDAPRFVILKFCAVDGRHPDGDDALALLAVMRAYRPRLQEKEYLLLEKTQADVPMLALPPEPGVRAHPGEWVDVPAGTAPVLARFDYRLSLLGRLRAFFLQEPILILQTQTANGDLGQYRLVRGIALQGFLLSPAVATPEDYLHLYKKDAQPRIAKVRVVPAVPAQAALFDPEMRVGFSTVELLDADESLINIPAH